MRENGGFELWWEIFEEVRNCGVKIVFDVFLVLILGYWRVDNVEMVVELFGKMRDFDCEFDVYVYNVILYVMV